LVSLDLSTVRYDSAHWSIDVPEGWTFRQDDECAMFECESSRGAVQISEYRKDCDFTDEDLRDLATETDLVRVAFPHFTGLCSRGSDDKFSWTKWWLRAGPSMVYVTHFCDPKERGNDDADIDCMLRSWTPTDVTPKV
jgi:hypothetical protein